MTCVRPGKDHRHRSDRRVGIASSAGHTGVPAPRLHLHPAERLVMSRRVPKPLLPVVAGVLAGVLALWAVSPSEAGMTQPGGPEGTPPATTPTTVPVPASPTIIPSADPTSPLTPSSTRPSAVPTWNGDNLPPNPKTSPPSTPGGECNVCM